MHSPYGLEIVESCLGCTLQRGASFCNLPSRSLDKLQSLGFVTACPKGSILITEGQSPREIFIVCVGHVKIFIVSKVGKRLCLGIGGPGTILGLSAAISGGPHQVTVETLEPCQLRVTKADRFLTFLRQDQAACFAALRCLSSDVRKMHACSRLLGLSNSAAQRLARVLVRWEMYEANALEGKPCLRFPLSHRELAEILGVSRETVTRLLIAFEKKELIHCCADSIVIKDEHTLRTLAVAA